MWFKVGNDYLNLDNVGHVHFHRDNDGMLTATVETVAGNARHYAGGEAEALRGALEALSAGSTAEDLPEPPP
jgi:hypothetical protein